ncbi:MAG: lysine--tRNA ligase [Patescibacteria group bacterium]
MSREEAVRQQRIAIRQNLISKKIAPYPQDGHRKHSIAEAIEHKLDDPTQVAGRITAMRGHGKIKFFDVVDESGKLQIVAQKNFVENFSALLELDVSDFIRVTGKRYLTNSGEPSIMAEKIELLSKSLRQIPSSWNGLSDEEARYRKRSVDLAVNEQVRNVLINRSKIIDSVRKTLQNYGFLEVETPVLQPMYGGANARPFTTHINAWDMPLYLRISPELYLKRLIMGGMEKVFEITHNFRNEGVDRTHNPEFTMMECYSAYWDYFDMMNLTEEIYRQAVLAIHGKTSLEYQGVVLDFGKPWKRLTMKQGINDLLGVDVDTMNDREIRQAIKDNGLEYNGKWIRGLGIAKLFELVEPNLIQPTFVIDLPRETTSLCKQHRHDPSLIERFEPYICGVEIGNAYTELNDPVLQRQFWEEERAEEDDAHPLDEDFIEAMEYGMPPTGGLGLGIDRMVMFLTNQVKLRDVIAFPTMKPLKKIRTYC